MPAALLNPHHAGHERNRGHLEATPSVVSGRAGWYAAARRERHRSHCQQVPLPVESQLRMETRTVDEPKLWNQDTPGAQPAEGDAQRSFLPSCRVTRKSWRCEVENGRNGHTGGGMLLRTLEHEEMRETARRLCSWVESIYDKHGKRTTLLWTTGANGDSWLDRNEEGRMVTTKGNVVCGVRPREENSNSREMRKTAQVWQSRPRGTTLVAPSSQTTGDPAELTTCGAAGGHGIGALLQNATDSGKEAATVSDKRKERAHPRRH